MAEVGPREPSAPHAHLPDGPGWGAYPAGPPATPPGRRGSGRWALWVAVGVVAVFAVFAVIGAVAPNSGHHSTTVSGAAGGSTGPTAPAQGVTRRVLSTGDKQVGYSRDGRTMAAVGADGSGQLWDLTSGKVERTLRRPTGWSAGQALVLPPAVVFAPDGRTVATLLDRKTLQIWDVDTGAAHTPISIASSDPRYPGQSLGPLYSPDGRTLATTGARLQLWDVATGTLRRSINVATFDAAFAPDGKTIAALNGFPPLETSAPKALLIWDVRSGARVRSFPAGGNSAAPVAFAPDGRTVIVPTATGVQARDPATGVLKWSKARHVVRPYGTDARQWGDPSEDGVGGDGAVYAPDGNTLALNDDEDVQLVDPRTGVTRRTLHGRASLHDVGGVQPVAGLYFAPGSRTLAVRYFGEYDDVSRVQLCDVATGTVRQLLQSTSSPIVDLAYAEDGRTVLTTSSDGTAQVWDVSHLAAPAG